jgi:hypothetical protein
MKFNVSDRVMLNNKVLKIYNIDEDNSVRGVVKAVSSEHGKVFVQWDSSWRKPNPEEVLETALLTEKEGEKILSKLEEEFNLWSKEVKEKVEVAAGLLAEAGKLAKSHGHELYGLYDIHRPLIRAMDDCGWNTSSFNC